MSLIEDITRMKSEGKTDEEISQTLVLEGRNRESISEAISQADIKQAVSPTEQTEDIKEPLPFNNSIEVNNSQMSENNSMQGMEPSIMSQQESSQQPSEDYSQYEAPAPGQAYTQQAYDASQYGYGQPQYSSGVSGDTISEIAEQVVSEKLSSIKSGVEKVIDFKTTLEAKMESLDDRLQRIEKIIDRLQLSILQKVGEYTTNIEDIKKELIETQKTFKSMSSHHNEHK